MKTYQAILTGGNPVTIGEFPSQAAAEQWALQEFGGQVSAVFEVPVITVSHAELNPAWYALAIVGALLLLAGPTRKKRKRGGNVQRTR
jgi:hypothetical protein